MRVYRGFGLLAVALACALPLLVGASTVLGRELVWQGTVYSSGVEVTGPLLNYGRSYVIVAQNAWWYSRLPINLAADAMYYTTDPIDSIFWGNNFPAPDGHSFLQINRHDVDWGPFSNGGTGHTYSVDWKGNDTAVYFRIVDWIDSNYTNNECHIDISIYVDVTVGGRISDMSGQVLAYFTVTGLIFGCATALPLAKKIRH